jgi:SNF2 family DNA or RNA helicase
MHGIHYSGVPSINPHQAVPLHSLYSLVTQVLLQAHDCNLEVSDRRMRVLLMMFHHLKSAKYMVDKDSIFTPNQLDKLKFQVLAYTQLLSCSKSIDAQTKASLGITGMKVSDQGYKLLQRQVMPIKFNPPISQPPLDGAEGVVDWINHLNPQLQQARRHKRLVDCLGDNSGLVRRGEALIDAQKRVRLTLLDLKRASETQSLPQNLPQCEKSRVRGGNGNQRVFRVGGKPSSDDGSAGFFSALLNHRREFFEFHKKAKDSKRRQTYLVLKHFASKSKDKETAEERLQRERIAALKAQDEEAYLRLLSESKDERLNLLIKQTEEYMLKLGALVLEGKKEEENESSEIKSESEETSTLDSRHALIKAKERYFKLAHTTNEQVLHQPVCITQGMKLRQYQLKGVEWMVSLYNNRLNGILADSMGLGKTASTIGLLAYLYENKGIVGPHLIIAPLSTLRSNWLMEFKRWFPQFADNLIIYEGGKQQRRELRQKHFYPASNSGSSGSSSDMTATKLNVILTSDAYILKDHGLLKKIRWEYIIVDEAHRLKNPKSKLVQVLNKNFISRQRLALTGTPLQNDLQEVWALLNFLMPKIFNSSESFQAWFASPVNSDVTEEEKLLIIDRLHKVLKPFILRRDKDEVEAQLPPRTEQVVYCGMSGVQAKMYEECLEGRAMLWGCAGMNIQMNLRKICNHPYLFVEDSSKIPADETLIRVCGKFQMLDNILSKLKISGHRVLLFSQMTKVLDILELYLSYRAHSYCRLDGTTSADVRESLVKQFNAPESPFFVFILSTRAGGLGLNLQTADTVIIFDSDWNPQADEQAQSRAHRIGQTKEVVTLRFITAGTVEDRMLQTAEHKLEQDQLIIQEGRFHDNDENEAAKRERIREILQRSARETGNKEITDLSTLNSYLVRNEDERILFEAVDARYVELKLDHLVHGRVFPPCLVVKNAGDAVEENHRIWKEVYQTMDLDWSLKLLAKQHSGGGAINGSDFVTDLKVKRHKLNESLYEIIRDCVAQFGWTKNEAPVLFQISKNAQSGAYQSLHEIERALDNILSVTGREEFFWVVRIIGAINMKLRRFVYPSNTRMMIEGEEEEEEEEGDETGSVSEESEDDSLRDIDKRLGFKSVIIG